MDTQTLQSIDVLIRREIIPATGCTEPASIALCVAYATKLLSHPLESIEVALSRNMLKNAMGVGIPGTQGMLGLPISIALGAILAKPEEGLQILDRVDEEQLEQAKALINRNVIRFLLSDKEGIDKLYIEVIAKDQEGNIAHSIIQYTHTGLQRLEYNGDPLLLPSLGSAEGMACDALIDSNDTFVEDIALSFDLVYDYALEAPLDQLEFIYQAALVNKGVAEQSLEAHFGHGLGKLMMSDRARSLMGDTPLSRMIGYTSGACDARMGGAPYMVMSNSGSGNQGITATLPTLLFAEQQGVDRETTTRALMMSSLMVVYIKQYLGRLSGLCGMVVSGIGTASALVYLMGGCREQSGYAIKNMIGNVAGMICDGAKPSCSLKASTGISSAMLSALLAMENTRCTSTEGIVHDDVDTCIRNLAMIGSEGMLETDRKILDLMMQKS